MVPNAGCSGLQRSAAGRATQAADCALIEQKSDNLRHHAMTEMNKLSAASESGNQVIG